MEREIRGASVSLVVRRVRRGWEERRAFLALQEVVCILILVLVI